MRAAISPTPWGFQRHRRPPCWPSTHRSGTAPRRSQIGPDLSRNNWNEHDCGLAAHTGADDCFSKSLLSALGLRVSITGLVVAEALNPFKLERFVSKFLIFKIVPNNTKQNKTSMLRRFISRGGCAVVPRGGCNQRPRRRAVGAVMAPAGDASSFPSHRVGAAARCFEKAH